MWKFLFSKKKLAEDERLRAEDSKLQAEGGELNLEWLLKEDDAAARDASILKAIKGSNADAAPRTSFRASSQKDNGMLSG
jgi:hypothetical protein